jgi:hypothetical protein
MTGVRSTSSSPQEMERMRFLRHVMGDEIAEHNAGRGLIGKPPLD